MADVTEMLAEGVGLVRDDQEDGLMGRRRRHSRTALLVALGLSVFATFALGLDIADPGPRRAIITVCLLIATATVFGTWHTIRSNEIADATTLANRHARRQHAEQRLRSLMSNVNSDH